MKTLNAFAAKTFFKAYLRVQIFGKKLYYQIHNYPIIKNCTPKKLYYQIHNYPILKTVLKKNCTLKFITVHPNPPIQAALSSRKMHELYETISVSEQKNRE